MTVNFFQMFVSSLLGGILGILFLIPFRKYFVSDKHGEYPFPEATASTQVLVSGEKGGSQAKPLLFAGLIGGLYDFIVATFGWWNENFTTRVCGWGEMVAEKAKLVMKINTGAAVLGLGYIVGLKYAAIICAGSLVVWLVIVPGMALLFGDQVLNAWNPALTQTISEMSPEVIFKEYAKSIGIGGIAMAGVIGIVRSWGIIKSAVGLAAKEMGGKKVEANVIRTQKDLSMKIIAFGSIFTILLILLFFFFDVMHGNVLHSIVAILLVAGIAFLFTTVAANAIAIVGTNPVSGMTLMTLILASVVMVAVGLKGATGMVAALVMGGVVCTALSMAGGFITDLKIGYWLGSTPAKQETWKFLGTLVSAATVGGVIMILNKTYGFSTGALAAPQANAMAAVIDPLMNGTSGKEICKAASDAGISLYAPSEGTFFHFADYRTDEVNKLKGEPSAKKIAIVHSESYRTSFSYSALSHTYAMQMYNSSKKATENTVDELTGEQLTFENVVVCFADMDAYAGDSHDVQEVQYIKGGDAYLFTRGGVQVGRWEKTYPTNPLKLYTKSGEEMTLNRGKTYFALVDNDELSNFSCQ